MRKALMAAVMGGLERRYRGDYINVKSSYVLGEDKKSLKTAFRKRQNLHHQGNQGKA